MKFPAALPEVLTRALTALPRATRPATAPRRGRAGPIDAALTERLDRQLILPCAEQPAEELSRAAIQDRGQFLARQDRWEDLSALVHAADTGRTATGCAMSHTELLCYGARADVVQAAEDALLDGANPCLDGIEALEEVLMEHPDDYVIATIVALAHADIGWAWRGGDWPHEIPERNLKLFEAHFDRAHTILAPFVSRASETASPLLASARCTLIAGQTGPNPSLADEYAALIDLDPANPRSMRALGNHLLPRWSGSYDALELEARRTAARTQATWGNGAYAWVFMDALAIDPGASRIVDIGFFVDGMRDILAARPDQHLANLLAAYAAIVMDPARTPAEAPDVLRRTRQTIFDTLDWILAEYLFELHPLVWAQASIGPSSSAPLPMRAALVRRGVATARQTIARHFADEIMRGTTIAFSRHGLRLYPAV